MPGFYDGVYYEFVALPCGVRYSMPLGVLMGSTPSFRVYSSVGLYRLLRSGVEEILLLSPRDVRLFWYSIVHSLEDLLKWNSCPEADESLGAWYSCSPILTRSYNGYDVYECRGFRFLGGYPPVYSRVYGCFVELLVLYTKLRAGVKLNDVGGYVEWLSWCIERSSPRNRSLLNIANMVKERIYNILGEG